MPKSQNYTQQKILAVLNNPNDYPPMMVAKMIDDECFSIDQLKNLLDPQKQKIKAALLLLKEEENYQKCKSIDATIEDCQFFIDNYKRSTRIPEIEKIKDALELEAERKRESERKEKEALDQLEKNIDDQTLTYTEKKKLLSTFQSEYPFTQYDIKLKELQGKIELQEKDRIDAEKENILKEQDENAWQHVLSKLASRSSSIEKRMALDNYENQFSLHKDEVSAKRQEISDQEDDAEWQRVLMVLAQDVPVNQKLSAINSYQMRYSRHLDEVQKKKAEVENELNIMPEINGILGNSASTVTDFMKIIAKHPSKKEYIRQYMMKDMSINPSRYSRESMYWLLNGKYDGGITYDALFSVGDLVNAKIATYDVLNHINTHPTDNDDRNLLEDSLLPEENFKSAKNNTDVYFFGVPGSGKSTVLAGLFKIGSCGNLRLSLPKHGDHIGYTYASILQNYLENDVFPQATKTRFVIKQDLTPIVGDDRNPFDNLDRDNDFDNEIVSEIQPDVNLIGTEVSDKFIQIVDGVLQENSGEENQEDHKISIIEMPGERTLDFAASDIKDPEKLDALLGKGTKELFMNDNRKLFFFVIDPKPKRTYTVNLRGGETPMTQAEALSAVVEFIDKVPGLLDKIDSMHIILSKSDLLSNPNSIDIINQEVIERGYEGLVKDIKGLCNPARSNINAQCNHNPYIFTFSLGKVYPGHMIKYNKADAEKILRVIAANTYSTRKNPTKLNSIIDWMNK
ncbi:MAG: hypothetical protein K2N35_15125 [Muribaculaceae bacterium]|nr:hypothetical protein [Muribaculaceae bacterium]